MNMHTQLDVEQATTKFKDKKRHLWLLGLAVPTIAMGGLAGYQFGPKKLKSSSLHLGHYLFMVLFRH